MKHQYLHKFLHFNNENQDIDISFNSKLHPFRNTNTFVQNYLGPR